MKQQKPPKFEINRTFTYQPCFQQNANLLSRIFFIWSHQIIRRDLQDLSDLKASQDPKTDSDQYRTIFNSMGDVKKNKTMNAFMKHFGSTFILAGVLATVANLLQFAGPLMIGNILNFLHSNTQTTHPDIADGVKYVSILVGCLLLRAFIFGHSMHFVNLSCVKVLNSANSLVYTKILNLSSASRKYLDTGSIMTHINVDIMSFFYFIMMSSFLFSAPIMIITAITLLIIEIGWLGLVAPLMFGIGMFFQNKITKKTLQIRKDQLFWTSKRTKCVNQYFSGIRIIKYYGWEQLVADKIQEIRTQQLKNSFKSLIYRTYIDAIMNMLPIFASIIIFGVYSAINGQDALTSAKVFTVLSIFNLIATPMRLVIMTIINFVNAKASLDRVDHFFGYEQKKQESININDTDLQIGDIQFKDCGFNWENAEMKAHHKEGEKLKQHKKDEKKKDDKAKNDQKPQKDEKVAQAPKKKKKKTKNIKSEIQGEQVSKPKKKKTKKKKEQVPITESQAMLNQGLLNQSQRSSVDPSFDPSSSSSTSLVGGSDLQIPKLSIYRGQFVSVIGRVGSGKTTFLSSILGQIDKTHGSLSRRGTLAYIPQVSWLKSATVRENIIFQSPFDQARYNHILKICELQADMSIIPGGDMTQIGQKGVNLSGGQKQRISIARALYADADIYLIDDCLSALDPYVGKNVFYNALKEHLHKRGKTIVFVTNAIHFTQQTDRIIVIDKGRIVEDDIPKSLKQHSSLFQNLSLQAKKSEQKQQEKKLQLERKKTQQKQEQEQNQDITNVKLQEDDQVTQDTKKDKQVTGLVKVQERLKGSVPWSFYIRFFSGPGSIKAILMFIFITLGQLSRVFSDWWLGQWGNNSFQLPSNTYIIVYSCISIVVGALIYLKGLFFAKFIVATSRVIQRKLIQVLLRSPLNWFDVTPTGRIIARTTKDQDDLDTNLSFNIQFSVQNLLVLFSSMILVSVATPLYLVVAVISAGVYYKLISLYMNSSRQIKRLQANSRAPLIGHISQTINGTAVIRAFNKNQIFIRQFYNRQKAYIVSMVNQNICSRWISIVTDVFAIVTIAAVGYFGVLSVAVDLGTSSNNMVGLALVWSLQINGIMSFTLRMLADTESCMNSVVRIYDYIDNNPSQKSFSQKAPEQQNWPQHGNYQIKNISYRYRPQLPLVLKQLSFDIQQKQKIGVVGRTGSGKSTLTLGLLRILQLAQNHDNSTGSIHLDNENVSQIGLHHLRHNVTIIPQDPTLFTGTLKTNIDPFNKYSDDEIAETLKKVNLWDQIKENEQEVGAVRKKVFSKVDDSGSNYSLGQKQLICMARALIRKPKVLLMDEATASIDEKTDDLIQNMIRTQFKDTTVITIAHRLNTIIYYDKILVLQKGEIKQYDDPLTLVRSQNTFLGRLIRKTGKKYMSKIIAMAENKTFKQE